MLESVTGSLVGSLRRSEPEADETELDKLIERRSRKGQDAVQIEEEGWRESVRAYHAERQEALRHQWRSHYLRIARSLRRRADEFDERADALETPRGD